MPHVLGVLSLWLLSPFELARYRSRYPYYSALGCSAKSSDVTDSNFRKSKWLFLKIHVLSLSRVPALTVMDNCALIVLQLLGEPVSLATYIECTADPSEIIKLLKAHHFSLEFDGNGIVLAAVVKRGLTFASLILIDDIAMVPILCARGYEYLETFVYLGVQFDMLFVCRACIFALIDGEHTGEGDRNIERIFAILPNPEHYFGDRLFQKLLMERGGSRALDVAIGSERLFEEVLSNRDLLLRVLEGSLMVAGEPVCCDDVFSQICQRFAEPAPQGDPSFILSAFHKCPFRGYQFLETQEKLRPLKVTLAIVSGIDMGIDDSAAIVSSMIPGHHLWSKGTSRYPFGLFLQLLPFLFPNSGSLAAESRVDIETSKRLNPVHDMFKATLLDIHSIEFFRSCFVFSEKYKKEAQIPMYRIFGRKVPRFLIADFLGCSQLPVKWNVLVSAYHSILSVLRDGLVDTPEESALVAKDSAFLSELGINQLSPLSDSGSSHESVRELSFLISLSKIFVLIF